MGGVLRPPALGPGVWMDGDIYLARKTNGCDLAVAMDIDGFLYTPIRCGDRNGWL